MYNRISFTRCYWNGRSNKYWKKLNSFCFEKNEQIWLAFDNYTLFIAYVGSHGGLFFWKQFFHHVLLHGYATLWTNNFEPVKRYVRILVESSYGFRFYWNNALTDFFKPFKKPGASLEAIQAVVTTTARAHAYCTGVILCKRYASEKEKKSNLLRQRTGKYHKIPSTETKKKIKEIPFCRRILRN